MFALYENLHLNFRVERLGAGVPGCEEVEEQPQAMVRAIPVARLSDMMGGLVKLVLWASQLLEYKI